MDNIFIIQGEGPYLNLYYDFFTQRIKRGDSYYGSLQAFADALKLLLKEYVAPTQANIVLFFLGPVITLIFALLGYGVIPYGPGLAISDFNLGILYMLAVSSLATYGILLAG